MTDCVDFIVMSLVQFNMYLNRIYYLKYIAA